MKIKVWMVVVAVMLAVVFSVIAMGVSMYFSISNQEIGLRNQAKAQQDANKVVFDKTWKVVQQYAQVTDNYKDAFERIYVKIMDARYDGKDNVLMNWITESNPNFSTELYSKLMDEISANKAEFLRVQERLIDIKREHDNLRLKFPGSLILSGRPEIVIQLVTSTKTEEAFKTGKDDDTQLFKK
jgi:flagellar basal body-associated protein FliL